MAIRTLVAVHVLLAAIGSATPGTYFTVCSSITCGAANSSCVGGCSLVDAIPNGAVSGLAGTVTFADTLMTTGWDSITVVQDTTGPNGFKSDAQKAYALGFAEGYLTNQRIEFNFDNQIADFLPVPGVSSANQIYDWIDSHIQYLHSEADAVASTPYGQTLGGLLAQLAGIADGFKDGCTKDGRATCGSIGFNQIFYTNFAREIGDLIVAFKYNKTASQAAAYKETLPENLVGHCSAMIKPVADDIFFSHVTWSGYNTMMRVFKTYTFGGASVSFTSYNGLIFSQDDWYMTGSRLAVMETTNSVFNDSLFTEILAPNPNVVSSFLRVMIANYLATSSPNWVEIFVTHNSGTYNNQWMVLDMNVVSPGTPFPKDALWIVETLPILYESADVSEVVNTQGYWGSYNIPYFPYIYNISGNLQMYEADGNFYSYSKYARAEIFARNHSLVKNLDDFKAMMRYNNFKEDPLSRIPNCTGATNNTCDPVWSSMLSIAARGDLMPASAGQAALGNLWRYFAQRPHAGTDCKISTYKHMTAQPDANRMLADVVVGPTTYNGNPIFEWANSPWVLKHAGLPASYNFTFTQFAVESARVSPVAREVDGTVRGIGYGIAAVGGFTVLLTVIALVYFAIHERSKKNADAGAAYTRI